MKLFNNFKWTTIATAATVVFTTICLFLMGGGHGTYYPAILAFPYGMFRAGLVDRIDGVSLALGALQFPVYGIIADLTNQTKWASVTKLTLLITHVLMIFCALANAGNFLSY